MNEIATVTAGMDLGDRYSVICVLSPDGEVVEETRIRTTQKGLEAYFGLRSRMRVVIEVGGHSRWVSQLLEARNHEVIVANPRRVRLIAENHNKSDQTDAELLARLGRADPELLAPIKHRSDQTQIELVRIRARAALVEARTALINSVRGQVKAAGYRMPTCSARSFGKRVDDLPLEMRESLGPAMECIAKLTEEVKGYDKEIEAIADEKYPETAPMRQITGVGALTSLSFVLTLEDATRFRGARSVGAYLGLTSRQRQSGKQDPQLRISKRGDGYMRKLLVQAAHYILGPFGTESALRQWGLKLAQRGGKNAKKRASVAVARKLAIIMYRLWVTGADYKPFPDEAIVPAMTA